MFILLLLFYYIFKLQPNFLVFVLMNFCQIYHSTFLANFTSIICDQLIGKDFMGPTFRSIFYGCMYILPQVSFLV